MDSIELCLLQSEESLESFLSSYLKLSKNKIKNSQLPKNYLQKALRAKDLLKLPIDLINQNHINPNYHGPEVEVLFQNNELIALNKPSSIHSHPLRYNESDNLLSFLRSRNFNSFLNVNTTNYDRGLLHRLDFETSGVILLTSEQSLYDEARINSDFLKRKEYLCIVTGDFNQNGNWIHCLKSSGEKGSMQIVVADSDQIAELSAEKIYYDKQSNSSLVRVLLKSGLRHQIRVQLSHLGHPIVGDVLYGGIKADRLYLHSYSYEMVWNNKTYQFQAKRAALFLDFLNLNGSLEVLGDQLLIS